MTSPDGLSAPSRQALVDWLHRYEESFSLQTGRPFPQTGEDFERRLARLYIFGSRILANLPGAGRLNLARVPVTGHILNMDVAKPYHPPPVIGSRRYWFPWAIDEIGQAYAGLD